MSNKPRRRTATIRRMVLGILGGAVTIDFERGIGQTTAMRLNRELSRLQSLLEVVNAVGTFRSRFGQGGSFVFFSSSSKGV